MGTRGGRARVAKGSSLANNPQTTYPPPVFQAPLPPPLLSTVPQNPPRPPIPTTPQALHSTYASRLRTGTTLLMQPIIQAASATTMRSSTRRGGVINYADPGSGDDMPDAGAIDSDDSDFVASGGTRTAIRQSRSKFTPGMVVFHAGSSSTVHPPQKPEKAELDQSYLGTMPPSKFIKARPIGPTVHEYPWVHFSFIFPVIIESFLYYAVHKTRWKNKLKDRQLWFLSASNSRLTHIECAIVSCGTYTRASSSLRLSLIRFAPTWIYHSFHGWKQFQIRFAHNWRSTKALRRWIWVQTLLWTLMIQKTPQAKSFPNVGSLLVYGHALSRYGT